MDHTKGTPFLTTNAKHHPAGNFGFIWFLHCYHTWIGSERVYYCRGKNQHKQNSGDWTGRGNDRDNQRFYSTADTCHLHDSASCCTGDGLESDDVTSLKDRIHLLEQHSIEKVELILNLIF